MSIIDDHNGSDHKGNSRSSNKRVQDQKREEVAKILHKVQEVVKSNADPDIDKVIDVGLVLSRTSEGFTHLFNNIPSSWEILFPKEFYREIYRLNNWPITEESLKNRPGIVGTWTNWMIYIRFPVGTIKWLREKRIFNNNSSCSGLKFHQFCTKTGRLIITDFIDSVIELMSKCKNWEQFKRLLAKGYGKPYQSDMFDKDEVDWRPSE